MKSNSLFLLIAILTFLLAACGGTLQTPYPTNDTTEVAPTEAPDFITEEPVAIIETPATDAPPSAATSEPTAPAEPLDVEEQLAQVDDILRKSAQASIAYNAPSEMHVDETVTIELLLNPRLSEEELKKQVSEPGAVRSSAVEITPLMKARLVAQDRSAFLIDARPDEEHAIQVISSAETTKWSWNVTAQKPGTQRLTISLSRLVKYEDEEFWREVGEYEADILVQVTLIGQLKTSGWKWIVGILIGLAAVSAFRYRRNQHPKERKKPGPAIVRPGRENLGRIFICYRRSDSADIAGRIYDRLVEEFGREPIFKDVDSIPLGVDFKEHLHTMVRGCRVLLAIIGDRWLEARDEAGGERLEDPADFVRIEIESALEDGIPVIPLLVRGAKMPEDENLPPGLRKLVFMNGVPIRPDPDFHHDMDRLIAGLNKYVR